MEIGKSDLKTGDVVVLRKDEYNYKVFKGTGKGDVLISAGGWLTMSKYGEDLTYFKVADFDIMKVYRPTYERAVNSYDTSVLDLIWERRDEVTWEEAIRAYAYHDANIKIVDRNGVEYIQKSMYVFGHFQNVETGAFEDVRLDPSDFVRGKFYILNGGM